MDITHLWTPLNPIEDNKEIIRQDLERGLAPNLPFFIVGLEDVKTTLKTAISTIDSRFSYALVWGQYGNGKSNLMKYLKYFFEQNQECNTKVAIWRADVDRYDIITFLLYIIQNEFLKDLQVSLKAVISDGKTKGLCDNYIASSASRIAARCASIFSRSSHAAILMKTPSSSPLLVMKIGSPVSFASAEISGYALRNAEDGLICMAQHLLISMF